MRRLTPLLTNLGIAAAFRLILPVTLAQGGERYLYYTMSLFFPYTQCPSFQCFRFLPPLIPSLLPLEPVDAFIVAGFVCQVLAATMLWHLAERVTGSRRIAALTTIWYWATWGPLSSLRDPLLITDPVQALWLMTALLLLIDRRFLAALPVIVTGAGVKESVLLAPMIYAAYLVFAGEDVRKQVRWLAVLVVLPIVTWVLARRYLIGAFQYALPGDSAYLSKPYLTGLWISSLGVFPRNVAIAALYVFAGFGSAWLFGLIGFATANRRVRALCAAAFPGMIFLSLYQEPHRAVSNFPFVMLIPAAVAADTLPVPLAAALIAVNAAFTIRMSATVSWLPATPVLFGLLVVLMLTAAYFVLARRARPAAAAAAAGPLRGGWLAPLSVVALSLILIAVAARGVVSVRAMTATTAEAPPPIAIVDDDLGAPGIAVSPDGGRLAYVAADVSGERRLYLCVLPAGAPQPIAGTTGAAAPFWAPDGRALGFFAAGRLKTIDLASGEIRVLAATDDPHGGAWGANGNIVFASGGGLQQIAATGGVAAPAMDRVDSASYRSPGFLPDGEHLLFVEHPSSGEDWLRAGSIRDRASHRVLKDAYAPVYAAPGVVFFMQWDELMVQPFDRKRLIFLGDPEFVTKHAGYARAASRAPFSATATTLAYTIGTSAARSRLAGRGRLRWFSRDGSMTADIAEINAAAGLALSPDGERALFHRAGAVDLSAWDFAKAAATPLLAGRELRGVPLPSPDGARIAFAERSSPGAATSILRVADRRAGNEIAIGAADQVMPAAWSPDGRTLFYLAERPGGENLFAVPIGIENAAPVHVPTAGRVFQMEMSPDGRWIAYAADGRGSREVYVQPFPADGRRWIVSSDGGDQPRWRADGRELVYAASDALMALEVSAGPSMAFAQPRRLFAVRLPGATPGIYQFAMTREATRFLLDAIVAPEEGVPLKVAVRWRGAIASVDSR